MDRINGKLEKFLLRSYKEHVSNDLAEERDYHCEFTPTCSEYTFQAIDEYGYLKGGVMGFMRMMRCHRGAEGGSDPVIPKDQEGQERGFVPAHMHYHYESADRIMAYGPPPPATDTCHHGDEAQKEEHGGIRAAIASGIKSTVTGACALAGGVAGAVIFGTAGAGMGAWLGTEAGLDKIDAVNAKIAQRYSPESVYGFAKIENAVGKPAYRLHKFIEEKTGSETCARLAGAFVGGPLGLALGLGKGAVKGAKFIGQFGKLFGKSVTGTGHRHHDHSEEAGRTSSTSEPFTITSTFLREKSSFEVGGTTLAPLFNEDAATGMEELVKEAKKSIDIEIFSISSDAMVSLLKEKLAGGVRVRILNTPPGRNVQERGTHLKALQELREAGAQVLEYPVFKSAWQFNHTKLLIVDDEAAIMGSKNWGNDARMRRDFDTAFLITGDTVNEARRIFERDWGFSGGQAREVRHRAESPNVALKVNEPFHHDVAEDILSSIKSAQHSIDVGMYWLTDRKVIEELKEAVKERHVAVRVLLSQSDENRATKEELERAGIEVKVFSPPGERPGEKPSYHTKMAVFDREKVILGSCDWTTQAFYLNHELDISVKDAKLAGRITNEFEKDWNTLAYKNGPFDAEFEMQGLARLNVMGRKISKRLPASIAKTGMMLVGMVSVAKRLFAPSQPPDIKMTAAPASSAGASIAAVGTDPLPILREPVKMPIIGQAEQAAEENGLTATETNYPMRGVSGNVLVKLAGNDGKITIPQASALARSVVRSLLPCELTPQSVTEIIVVDDLHQVDSLAASPSGQVHRREGEGIIMDTDAAQPFRRLYILRDRLTPDLKAPSTMNSLKLNESEESKSLAVPLMKPREIHLPVKQDSSIFCGGLVSISAEPPEGFFTASTAMEMRDLGHPLKKAPEADIWLYRVPDSRKDSYFKFNYACDDRPADTPREGKFKIATGFGPASDPASEGGAEADLLWFGDEFNGPLADYLKSLSKPDLKLEDLYGSEGVAMRLSGKEVFLGGADRLHALTKRGFSELKTDPELYRRVYSTDYDGYLKSIFSEIEGPPAAASYLLATSRGCSQGCSLCCCGGAKSFQFFNAPRMMEELEKIAAHAKVKKGELIDLFLLDSNLNNNAERLIELAQLYDKSPLKGKFRFFCRHSSPNGFFTLKPDGTKEVNRRLIDAYGRLGLKEVFMGIDTYDDYSTLTLKTGRGKVAAKGLDARPTYRADEIRSLVKALDEGGLTSRGFFVTNNPWVSDLDRLDSYYNVFQLWMENPHFSIDAHNREVLQLKPFEGSPITDVAQQMKLPVVERGRFVTKGILGELDESMQFGALNSPRFRGDVGAAIAQFREGIAALRQKADAIASDPSSSAADRRDAELIQRKLIQRDLGFMELMTREASGGIPQAGDFLNDAKLYIEAHGELPPFDPSDQRSEFLKRADSLFDGLRHTLPLKMALPDMAGSRESSPGKVLQETTSGCSQGCSPCRGCKTTISTGYREEIASLKPGEAHTVKNLEKYMEDNLGAETLQAIKSGKEPFVIWQGEGSEVKEAMKQKGWKVLNPVDKREGFHQVYHMENEKGEPFYAVVRVNGDDRVLHLQSFFRLMDLPAERLTTMGAYASFKDEYLRTFEKLGHKPDYVIYGMGKTAATALMTSRPLHNARELGSILAPRFLSGTHSPAPAKPEISTHDLDGLSMQVMTLENGKHLWFFPPLYGDLSRDLAEALAEFGAPDITFMGTAGAVNPSFHVGQVVSPAKRVTDDGNTESLQWLAPSPGATPCTYTRVATPNIETERWARETFDRGVDSIEVELGYWLDELAKHPGIRLRVQNVISDVIQGEHHADMTQWSPHDNLRILGTVRKALLAGSTLKEKDLAVARFETVSLRQRG
jgi:uncharacterized protein